uniref:Uncharacterized protein n=1 Tax=Poecilia formosa TaxID=48698 RepID=A0A096M555_POEFO
QLLQKTCDTYRSDVKCFGERTGKAFGLQHPGKHTNVLSCFEDKLDLIKYFDLILD